MQYLKDLGENYSGFSKWYIRETCTFVKKITTMKKLLVFTMALFFVAGMFAQDEQEQTNENKGDSPTMWLGGELTFGSMSNLDFTFGPSFGILIGNNMGVGGALLFSSGNSAYEWGLEPYFRYYLPVADQFAFYGDAFFGIGGGDNDTDFDGGDYNWLDFGVRAGLQYWFVPRWSVAASTNILTYTSTNNDGEFGAGVSFNTVNFALFFHF
jgi:hypothetical protein